MKNRVLWPLLAALALAALLAFLLLKARPGSVGSDPFVRLPRACEQVVVVPELGRLGARLAVLQRLELVQLGASLLGQGDVEGLLGQLSREAGFDPRSAESMRAAGLDPARPLVAATLSNGLLAALPESDGPKLEQLVARHASARLGASIREERAVAGTTVVTWSRAAGQPPVLAAAHVDDHLLLATGAEVEALVRAALERKPEESLSADPTARAARDRLASTSEVFLYGCPGAPAKGVSMPGGSAVGLALSETELRLEQRVPLASVPSLREHAGALRPLPKADASRLLAPLDPEAFALVQFGGDPAVFAQDAARVVPRAVQRALRAAGVDLGEELLGNLKPGAALVLRLSPAVKLGMMPSLDPRRTNPFDYLHLQALGRVRDAGKATQTFEKIAAAAPRFGASVSAREVEGVRVFTTQYPLGEGASFALKEDLALVTGGSGQMETLLGRHRAPVPPLEIRDAGAQEALEQGFFVAHLDVARLVASVRALPDSAYGIGGFAIKAAVLRWLGAVEELQSMRLSARVEGDTLRTDLAVSIRPAPGAPQEAQR